MSFRSVFSLFLAILILSVVFLGTGTNHVVALENGVARTPPMQ